MKNKPKKRNQRSKSTGPKLLNHRTDSRPIGVFDSGLGGLTVVREIRRQLPKESIVYFGDIARLPYGIKSKEQILSFSIQNTLFLLKKKVKAVVIACNSSSSAAYRFLRNHFHVPVLDVISPAVRRATETTRNNRVGVIATQATIASGSYDKALKRENAQIKVFSASCPLFVPLVEEGWLADPLTDKIIERYLKPLKKHKVDTVILGCTHYPLLAKRIQKALGRHVRLIDSAEPTVHQLASELAARSLRHLGNGRAELNIFVSDMPRNFKKIGEDFLGEKLRRVEVVRS